MTRLVAGATLQEEDYVSFGTIKEGCTGSAAFDRASHTVTWSYPRPIASHTIGRVILPADLINGRYFRP